LDYLSRKKSRRINMNALRLLVPSLALVAGQHATAAILPGQWGVTASTYWADCSFLPSCDKVSFQAGNEIHQQGLDGGLNQSMAFQSDMMDAQPTLFAEPPIVDMGSASAEAELDTSNTSVPILRASAASNSINGWVSGLALGIAGFNYSGPAGSINLSATLTGSVLNNEGSDTTGLSVGVWLIRDDGSLAFPDPAPASLNDLAIYVAGLPTEDFWVTEQTATDDAINVTTMGDDIVSIAFTDDDIGNGNTLFYLMAALVAGSTYADQSATSLSTLTMAFDDTSNLEASAPVPVPPAIWMLGSALLWLAFVGRRGKAYFNWGE
jgi:hypothetical protein